MKSGQKFSVLLADTDTDYMHALHTVLEEITGTRKGISLTVTECSDLRKMAGMLKKDISMVVIHDTMLLEGPDPVRPIFQKNKDCKLVVLISQKSGGRLGELMQLLENKKGACPNLHLLRDDHSLAVLILVLEDILQQTSKKK